MISEAATERRVSALAGRLRELEALEPGRARRLRGAEDYEAMAPILCVGVEFCEATGLEPEELRRRLLLLAARGEE